MIEIKTNIKGDIVCRETEEAKGIGTIWIFEDLQNYIIKNRVDRNVLHHLCRMCVEQMERVTMFELKEAEMVRLSADMERLIRRVYYPETKRDFSVRFADEQIELLEEGKVLQKITMKRFEKDLEYEPDVKQNAIQLINFVLEGRRLSNEERDDLADKIVEVYNQIREAKTDAEFGKKKADIKELEAQLKENNEA